MHLFLFACHLPSSGTSIAINDMAVSKKKVHRPHVLITLRLQSPSKPTLFVCVQNSTSFLVFETAQSVVFTAQRGQNSCAQLRGNIGCNDRLNEWD